MTFYFRFSPLITRSFISFTSIFTLSYTLSNISVITSLPLFFVCAPYFRRFFNLFISLFIYYYYIAFTRFTRFFTRFLLTLILLPTLISIRLIVITLSVRVVAILINIGRLPLYYLFLYYYTTSFRRNWYTCITVI